MPARRLPLTKSYPMVRRLQAKGYDLREIAEKLHKSVRQIQWILANGAVRMDGVPGALITTDPIGEADLKPEVIACLENSPEGFERFFNRYSGYKFPRGSVRAGERSLLQPHSKEMVKEALNQEAVIINLPPRHGKSAIFSVWLPLWYICRNRNIQILLLSRTHEQALKFSTEMASHLEGNRKLIDDFGRFIPAENSSTWSPSQGKFVVAGRERLALSGDITLRATGAGMRVYGMEFDVIIADDVVDDENSATPQQRESLARWFHNIIETRLSPDGRTVVAGTRFHSDDLYGHLLSLNDMEYDYLDDVTSEQVWEHVEFPAVRDWGTKEVLWPDVWPFPKLMKKRRRIGKPLFDQAYQQDPIPSDARLVQPEWVQGCYDLDRAWGPCPKEGTRVIAIDPSPTQYWGWVIADVASDRRRFFVKVLEVFSKKMGLRDSILELERLAQVYHPDALVFEKNAAQRWFFEDLGFEAWRRRWGVRAIDHETGRNKVDPVQGLQSIGRDFEYATIRLPGAGPADRQAVQPLVSEALAYPFGRTDDVLMALWEIKAVHQRRPFTVVPKLPEVTESQQSFHVPRRLQGRPFAWTSRR